MWGNGPVGGPFALTDHVGRRRTDADFRGKLLLIYFGYLYCPDICPTDLQAMGSAIDQLGPSGDAVQPLFITLDPERDTPDRLADYVTAFHPRFVGLTGSEDEIKSIARAYKVYYTRANDPRTTDYILNHSAFIYLRRRGRQVSGLLPPRHDRGSPDRGSSAAGRPPAGTLTSQRLKPARNAPWGPSDPTGKTGLFQPVRGNSRGLAAR